MTEPLHPLHATTVACVTPQGWRGVLIQGPSGVGKSDLALRLIGQGWRLVADALAHIQIGLLSGQAPASPLAQEGTQQLFASLRHALPDARYQAILAHSGQAVVAWQQAARGRAH